MRRFFAVPGAALLVALGLFLPRLTAAVQDRGLAADVRRMENAAVSLTLAQELVELAELDLFESLELFSSPVTMVELEEGRYTSAEGAARAAGELAAFIPADAYLDGEALPTEAVPFLLTDMYGHSGVFWRCGWADRPGEAVWIDDQNRNLMGFCLRISTIDLDFVPDRIELCIALCDHFFLDVGADVFLADGGQQSAALYHDDDVSLYAELYRDENAAYLPVHHAIGYLSFNLSFPPDLDAGIASGEAASIAE